MINYYFSSEIGLDVGVLGKFGRMTSSALHEYILQKILVGVVVGASVSEVAVRHEVVNLVGGTRQDVLLHQFNHIHFCGEVCSFHPFA
mmetsp:Transcript_2015/g.1924  ORF Transcript_2015/g.1924 Transcript_2015/m.1924 type:complete len:88 (-) Transcript_2015:197-460(-)